MLWRLSKYSENILFPNFFKYLLWNFGVSLWSLKPTAFFIVWICWISIGAISLEKWSLPLSNNELACPISGTRLLFPLFRPLRIPYESFFKTLMFLSPWTTSIVTGLSYLWSGWTHLCEGKCIGFYRVLTCSCQDSPLGWSSLYASSYASESSLLFPMWD